ncbi:hypothetical protein ACEYYA_02280 [Paracoccus sp. p3-h83]|uniref:hypothetical protein n=1 Tax=Paracoccus sp. p3-h83 TaxID=3342805 RepID=UPI0035B86275
MAPHNPARYDPVEHVTRDEAEKNKRRLTEKEAAHAPEGKQSIPGDTADADEPSKDD